MFYDFAAIEPQQRYKLLSSTITPRPIAWVTSVSENGTVNAAPFSFFNAFAEAPPVVAFSILSRSTDDRKDTGRNVHSTGEFVVNLVSEDNLDRMNVTAIDFGPDVSEIDEAHLTTVASRFVKPPRIAESHVSFECKLMQVIPLGEMRSLVLGEVLAMHVDDEAVIDAERCWIDPAKLGIVGRGGANSYVKTANPLTLPSITVADWASRKKR
jgi:flavin reductase (DIM6/NTAB) family NADH-FMN oxidoreductase RutF